jgi:hypothetical protein
MRWLTPVILATWETDWEDSSSTPTQANSSQEPISKITKWTGGVAQVVELICKHETLSSNSSQKKEKKGKKS